MRTAFESLRQIATMAVICGFVTVVLAHSCAAQRVGEPLPEAIETVAPAPPINSCYQVNFDKVGSAYSLQNTLDFNAAFEMPQAGCLADKISALKPRFIYRYWLDPNQVPSADRALWQQGCKDHCRWLRDVTNEPILDRVPWGGKFCSNLSPSECDVRYESYKVTLTTNKNEFPLLPASEYMDLSSRACSDKKCSTPFKACKVRCGQMLPRQCYWQSWCKNSKNEQLRFCGTDPGPALCADRVYADDNAVEHLMIDFFGAGQWPSGETDTVRCQDAVPSVPTEIWKSSNCVDITSDACNAKYVSTYAHLQGRCATGSFALDSQCNLLTHNQARGCVNTNAVAVHWLASSPISLIWDATTSLRESASVVNFKLDDSSSDKWYRWYGSAKAPLLVYDPAHSGRVESAHQLFGNWTFGGQRVASLALGMKKPKPWSNGYEALETLDNDGNGVISGEELAPLALWFDENRDARAQEGEVRDIRSTGVVSLAVGPQKRDSMTRDVSVDKGFERLVDGRIETGRTIDWFSDGAPTMQQLVLADQMRLPDSLGRSTESESDSEERGDDNETLHRLPDFADPRRDYASDSKISGVWVWGSKDQTNLSSHQGLIAIRERKNGQVEVMTVGEIGVRDSAGVTRALQKYYLMTGSVTKGADGSIKISFKDPNKNTSESVAILDERSGVLRGETTQRVAEVKGTTSIKYSWEARKALRQ